jgi:NhaC family Na+:H+ antiporter
MVQPSYAKRSYVAFINSMAFETARYTKADAAKFEAEFEEAKEGLNQVEAAPDDSSEVASAKQTVAEAQAKLMAVKLLKGKGMDGMLNTIWLIITAMCFGGVMEACGLLKRITDPLIGMAQSTGSLIATTAGSCVFVNATASDQYLAIVVPGQMFRDTYAKRGLAPQNLSRTLEDAGTVTSVLIPWNTCGAAQSAVLGVATFAYAPFCFFNWISPLMTIAIGFAGLGIAKLKKQDEGMLENELEG